MPTVIVTDAGDGKFKVLINFLQEGIDYNTRAMAEAEAEKIREKYASFYTK